MLDAGGGNMDVKSMIEPEDTTGCEGEVGVFGTGVPTVGPERFVFESTEFFFVPRVEVTFCDKSRFGTSVALGDFGGVNRSMTKTSLQPSHLAFFPSLSGVPSNNFLHLGQANGNDSRALSVAERS